MCWDPDLDPDHDLDPKLTTKPDPDTKQIILDPQHCSVFHCLLSDIFFSLSDESESVFHRFLISHWFNVQCHFALPGFQW
jgi:hypothetical protein